MVKVPPASNKPFEKRLPKKRKISLELSEDLFETEGKPIVSGETLDAFKLPQTGGYYDRMSLLQCSTEAACHAYNVLQGSLSIRAFASQVTAEAMSLRKENDALKMKLKVTEDMHNRTVEELEVREKGLEEKILDQAAFYTLRARGELMEQLRQGEHSKWDLAKEQAMVAQVSSTKDATQVSPTEDASENTSPNTNVGPAVVALAGPNEK